MTIFRELPDELLKGCERPEDLLGDAGLLKELRIKLMERMLGAERRAHPGYGEGKDAPPSQSNRRNGTSAKRLKGQDGEVPIFVPRDREGRFESGLVNEGQPRIDGMDDKMIGLYAAGLTIRDIRAPLEDVHGLKVSADQISRVADAVLDGVREWRCRALERMCPIVIFDALRVKIRDADSRRVKNKAVYVAPGVSRDGVREVPGPWIAENEGAKFWLPVLALGDERVEEPRGSGHPHRRRRWAQGLSRSDHGRLPGDHRPDLHRASGAPFLELLLLEGSQRLSLQAVCVHVMFFVKSEG